MQGLQNPPTSPHRARRWYSPTSIAHSIAIRPRVYSAALAGVAALVLLPQSLSASVREVLAWDVSALVYLALAGRVMWTCTGEVIRARAARQDDSAVVILIIILLAIAASFGSIAGLLNEAKEASHDMRVVHLALAASTILLSWCITQVTFTLHYAHEYYRPRHGHSSPVSTLDFPGDDNPDYWDFFYFATSFGAASQTSDVSIRSKPLRRIATLHAIISFFFNTAVLAFAINLAASLI